jgi:hypothetical protein
MVFTRKENGSMQGRLLRLPRLLISSWFDRNTVRNGPCTLSRDYVGYKQHLLLDASGFDSTKEVLLWTATQATSIGWQDSGEY